MTHIDLCPLLPRPVDHGVDPVFLTLSNPVTPPYSPLLTSVLFFLTQLITESIQSYIKAKDPTDYHMVTTPTHPSPYPTLPYPTLPHNIRLSLFTPYSLSLSLPIHTLSPPSSPPCPPPNTPSPSLCPPPPLCPPLPPPQVISAAEAVDNYEDLVPYLEMARKDVKEQVVIVM